MKHPRGRIPEPISCLQTARIAERMTVRRKGHAKAPSRPAVPFVGQSGAIRIDEDSEQIVSPDALYFRITPLSGAPSATRTIQGA
jgi:hypothetical protein